MLVKRKSRSGLRILKVLLGPVLILSPLFYVFLYSDVLDIKSVVVEGSATPEEAERIIGGALHSNIFFWQPKSDALLESKFASINIEKNFIDRSVTAVFEPRSREMIWCYKGGEECFWADENGLIFEGAPKPSGNLIKWVLSVSEKVPTIGEYAMESGMYGNLRMIFGIIEKLNIVVEDAVVEDANLREFRILVKDGPAIRFNLAESPDFTEVAISSLLKSDSWPKIKSINLTVYGRAYSSF